MKNLIAAIVFIPTGPSGSRWLTACTEYAVMRGYTIIAVVTVWADVLKVLRAGEATIVVVGQREHLPPEREPRLEVVTEEKTQPVMPPKQRRVIRRRTREAGQ